MSDPYIGEVKFVAFNFAPKGYALCNGQILPINQNQALFSILGTVFGGNGQTNFALPNLQGRVPVHPGANGINQGTVGGEQNHTLTINEMPTHNHFMMASNQPSSIGSPAGNYLPTNTTGEQSYASPNTPTGTMAGNEIGTMGGSQAHSNMQPYLVINAIIALVGLFPPRN